MKINGYFRRGLFCLMFFIAFILPNLAFAEVEKEVGPNPEFFFKENPHSGIKLGLKNLEAFNELDSQVYIGLDGSFGDFYYFRDSEGNRLLPDNEINWELLKTKHFKGLWEVGVSQGLLPGISEYNLLYANVAYRGMYYTSIGDYPNSILSNTDIPENGSYVTTAGIISLNFDNVESNEHYVRSGIQSVLSVEWAPAKMNTVGDYFLSSFLFESYLPLFDLEPTNEANSFSLNWANRIGLNYINGTNIPIPTSYKNNFDVRGIESERYDTRFSAVNMTELRMGLPGIPIDFLGIYQMIPSLLIYTDVGYFWESEQYNGIVMSHGAAIYLNMFNDAIQIGARLDYLSIGSKIDESKLTPVSLMFGYCY